MIGLLDYKVRRAKRAATYGVGGALCLMVGLGFLTVAAWIALVAASDTMTAALIIGSTYAGIGFVMFFVASRPPVHAAERAAAAAPVTAPVGAPAMFLALLQGVAAGTAAASARRGH